MDVACNQDLVEIWIEMTPPPPHVAITPYISRIWPRPLPTIMRRDSTPQERQFKPMDVTRSQDLVELWANMCTGEHVGVADRQRWGKRWGKLRSNSQLGVVEDEWARACWRVWCFSLSV
jgi:hypothetical protein